MQKHTLLSVLQRKAIRVGMVKHYELSYNMTEQTKWPMHPAKTQISLDIRTVWSVFAVRLLDR